jgi:hypothetical protein
MTADSVRAKPRPSCRSAAAAAFPYATFLVAGAWLFPAAGRDDAHISYWAARTLTTSGEILNYNGVRVEQSSSLLQVFALAAAWRLARIDLVTLATLLSVAFGLLSIWMSGRLATAVGAGKQYVQLTLATATPFVYWSFSGHESSLAAAALVALLLAHLRVQTDRSPAGWALLAVAVSCCLTVRPESIFVVVAFLAIVGATRYLTGQGVSVDVRVGTLSILLFAGLAAGRAFYFHSLFPQPVAAKIGGGLSVVRYVGAGLYYVARSVKHYPVSGLFYLFPLGLAAEVMQRGLPNVKQLGVIGLSTAYLLFLCTSGGDWMEGGRLVVPILPALIVSWVIVTERYTTKAAVMVFVAANLATTLWFAHRYSSSAVLGDSSYMVAGQDVGGYSAVERINRVHYRDAVFLNAASPVVRRYLEALPGTTLTLMSLQAGMVNYHLFSDHPGRLQFIDARGLASREFTDCRLTSGWIRTHVGVGFSYDLYFPLRDRLERECGLVRPDVIYDLDDDVWSRAELVARNGYHVVYRQAGGLWGAPPFNGGYVPLGQFLAVSDRLYELLPTRSVFLDLPK